MMNSPFVLAVVARKGGVGKSTLARSLAVQALLDGQPSSLAPPLANQTRRASVRQTCRFTHC
jgi:Mrp family chromosome partitioning ATPase